MVQQLSALAALPEDESLILRARLGLLILPGAPTPGVSDTFFWPLPALPQAHACVHVCTLTHTQ